MAINLPIIELRDYQKPLWKFIQNGGKRAIAKWHRRCGKDLTLWNLMIWKAFERKGTYYYLLPTMVQSKKIIWDGITNDGKKFMDYCPPEIIFNKNASELKIELTNGSIIHLRS